MIALLAQVGPSAAEVDTPHTDWTAIMPQLILFGGAIVLLTVTSLVRRTPPGTYAVCTVAVAVASIVSAVFLWNEVRDRDVDGLSTLGGAVGVDGFSVFFTVVIACSVVLAALLADDYLRREHLDGPDLYVLMLLSAAGGVTMASANDLIVMFLGLEVLSIAVYVMAAMHLRRVESQEAGMKYFVLGAFSSAFFLYGIALVYGATGSTNLVTINQFLVDNVLLENGLLLIGFALLLVGFGFKVAAVPFHAWTPDVYQGSPSPVVAYMASGVKAAGFAGLLRVFFLTFGSYRVDWQPLVYALAVATLLVGAVLAVVQTDVKRMLAYSSINHAGFVLVGVQAANEEGVAAALFYLATYTFMVAGAFGVVTLVGRTGDSQHSIDDYRGLAKARPVLALALAVFLLAQAGVPFTSGFFAKFYVLAAAAEARSYWLALVAMVSAVISAYVYLRIIVAMYMSEGEERERIPVPLGAAVSLALTVGVTVVVGFLPWLVQEVAKDATPLLVAAGS